MANPQSWNRFSYVQNDPISLTDPTGHAYCDFINSQNAEDCNAGEKNIATTSVFESQHNREGVHSGGSVCGQPGDYSPTCPGYHNYSVGPDLVCPAAWKCTQAEMIDYLSRFAYPGQDSSQEVVGGKFYFVDWPGTNESMGVLGAIRVDVKYGGLETDNVTLSTHIFYTGEVDRSLVQNKDGSWSVVTHGIGNNIEPGNEVGDNIMADINKESGPGIFEAVDEKMLNYIAQDFAPTSLIGNQPK